MPKAKDPVPLQTMLEQARLEAEAFIDARAAELQKETPGVPIGVLRQLITGGSYCQCAIALKELEKKENGTV